MPELKMVPINQIQIPAVRVSSILNEEEQAFMESTIKSVGVIQDIVVRQAGIDVYELVAGKSRLRELEKLGYTKVQVKVIDVDPKVGLIMNIVENVARGSYDYISISQSIRKLRELGATDEELIKVFPWQKRWLKFIEELQDLPVDVVEALQAGVIKPTHVQLALNLPTPFEVHDGLKTAINLKWNTATFKVFVENRVEQISRARQEASAKGVAPEIPPANPSQLIGYKQCLVCGYKKPANEVVVQLVCEGCFQLTKYITDQLGPSEEAIQTIFSALQAYFGKPQPPFKGGPKPILEPSQV